MRIVLIVEGDTERVLLKHLRLFLKERLGAKPMPKLESRARVPIHSHLEKDVKMHLARGADAVVALTDVYTGQSDFRDAADAIDQLTRLANAGDRFHAHAAQWEFEAWLLPYWDRIRARSGSTAKPSPNPEAVNGAKPPSQRLKELYARGGRRYDKVLEADAILKGKSLLIAAEACPQLKAFLNTLLRLSGGESIQ